MMVIKKEEKQSIFFSHNFFKISIFFILIIILLLVGFYLYFSSQFNTGDIVFLKGDVNKLGVVKAFSFSGFGYFVSWNDGASSIESVSNIEKIGMLDPDDYNPVNSSNGSGDIPVVADPSKAKINLEDLGDYAIQISAGNAPGAIFYKGFSSDTYILKKACKADLICGNWSECKLDYGLVWLSRDNISKGIQYHECSDNNNCLPNLIDSRSCSLGENISVSKKIVCGYEKIELTNSKGVVVARLDLGKTNNFVNVDIKLIPSGEERC